MTLSLWGKVTNTQRAKSWKAHPDLRYAAKKKQAPVKEPVFNKCCQPLVKDN
ncbi:MAG: hypothetical protein ACI88A_001162 [Paraglaciecola sp.]|jgi:hypothetical protein